MTDRSRERPGPVDWLTEALDTEVELYEPDAEHIRGLLNERLEELLDSAEHDRRERFTRRGHGISATGIRLAGIPIGIAATGLSAAIAVAVTVTVTTHPHTQTTTAAGGGSATASGLPTPAPDTTKVSGTQSAATVDQSTATTKPSSPGRSASAPDSTRASASASASQPANTGPKVVGAAGGIGPNSTANWTEEDVFVTLDEPLSSLRLVVRVAQSPGLVATSYWSNYDINAFSVTVNSSSGGLDYTFELKQNTTLPAGGIEFAVQFQHNASRNTSNDAYSLSVTTDAQHGSVTGSASGGF